ncbi:hypothetical protein CANARDRAFT_5872 [[Candida] arabinofermentans NRRL YB-2248]|uniref:Ams2/SPT21 N-terminal domain-containing protein n=1 Tax=[Candida] arabinofermentans NRRL YB-2248 TaxID=983967 RepID=A0A1E4T6G7_9ASCO|nr:hypothetical protein CANARDRAFT_5872 [[Candida] arabinofermentans NRRL YB-2248]
MSSNSQTQPYNQQVILKVLYSFDSTTTFLVRSSKAISSKVIQLPSKQPYNGTTIGCIDIKKCVGLVSEMSPEKFLQNTDYSIYSKDVVEPDEPFVGHGLYSKIIDKRVAVLVTGRICKNFVSLYTSGAQAADTLEVRLRFNIVEDKDQIKKMPPANSVAKSKKRKQPNTSQFSDDSNSSPINIQSHDTNTFQEPITKRRSSAITTVLPSTVSNQNAISQMKLHNKNLNAPELATRTQSLPFLSQNSLAHKIMLSDMTNKEPSREEDIASRFSSFSKLMKTDDVPTKANRSKSFVPKISEQNKQQQQRQAQPEKCVNCSSTADPPYRFHKEGIFEFGNSGLLCCICNDLQSKNDTFDLRNRGELGSKGLLNGPYSKTLLSNATNNQLQQTQNANRKKAKTTRKKSTADDIISSPATISYSSPLEATALAKSKMKNRSGSAIQTTLRQQPVATYQTPVKTDNITADWSNLVNSLEMQRLMNLSSEIDDLPGRQQNQRMLTDLDPIYHSKAPTSSSAAAISSPQESISRQQQITGPDSTDSTNIDDESDTGEDQPINATKLNTTLIPFDDDDKENNPPFNAYHISGNSHKKDDLEDQPPLSLLVHEISPSIHRLIESFTQIEERGSPSKPGDGSPSFWINDLFTHDEAAEDEEQENLTKDLEMNNVDDLEILRVMGGTKKTPLASLSKSGSPLNMKIDKTPKDNVTPRDAERATDPTTKTSRLLNEELVMLNSTNNATISALPVNMSYQNSMEAPVRQQKKVFNMPSSPFFMTNNDDFTDTSKVIDNKQAADNNHEDKEANTSTTERSGMSKTSWDDVSSPMTSSDMNEDSK